MAIREMTFPVELNVRSDGYAISGSDADGRHIEFDDLVGLSDLVASANDGEGNWWPPYGRVVERDGGLFVDPSPADDEAHEKRVRELMGGTTDV